MFRGLLTGSLALFLAACGASGAPASAGPVSGGDGGGGSGLPAGVTLPPGAVPTTSVPATIDSCALLSDEEIKLATGEGVSERKPSTLTQVFSSVCDVALDGGGSLTVSILPSGGRDMWRVSFEPTIGSELLAEAVPDLGDAAGRSANGDDVMVLKDDVLLDIFFIEFGRQEKLPVVRYLAEIVINKLPCVANGCAGVTPPPAPSLGPSVVACTLLTEEEIKDATHFATTGREAGQPTDCRWTLDTGSTFPGLHSIGLSVQLAGGRQLFPFLSEGLPQVEGLGDGAFKVGGNTGGSIEVLTGDRLITLNYSLPDDTIDPDPLVIPLLESALSRLPA